MTEVEVIALFKVKAGGQEITLHPEQRVKLKNEIAERLISEGKVKEAKETIQGQGRKVIDHARIDATLRQIGHEYRPGLVSWIKGQSDRWAGMLDIEGRINKAALAGDREGLNVALGDYKGFMTEMVKAFGASPEKS